MIHEFHIKYCLRLAELAMENGNPPVGSVIVHGDSIIGEGIEAGKTSGDITDHAEILAIRNAISKGNENELKKATLYTTHEPCIMCSYVIRHHQIPMVVIGASVDFIGGYTSEFNVLSTTSVPQWKVVPKIMSNICEAECLALSEKFKQ